MSAPEAFFLPADPGQRFCVYHPAEGSSPKGALVYIHPFAEEMNKARRMAALQSRQLATAGYAVLQIDLHGCGDSSGDFGEASWDTWQEDIKQAVAWLRSRTSAPLWLWGLRSGCLLAGDAAAALAEPVNFLFWQPVANGKQYLQQFLRLKMAGELLGGDAKGAMDALRREMAAGRPVEIAGYSLSPALANGIEKAELALPTKPGRLIWFELSSRLDATLSPVAVKWLHRWRESGQPADGHVATGPSFWQTTEIEESPTLLAMTLDALETGTR